MLKPQKVAFTTVYAAYICPCILRRFNINCEFLRKKNIRQTYVRHFLSANNQAIMQKIKEKLHIGRNKHHNDDYVEGGTYDNTYGNTYGTNTGLATTTRTSSGSSSGYGDQVIERPVAVGVAEVPVVVTEQERIHTGNVNERHHEEVCGVKTFTEVEDRPIVKERVERILEHHPVEKQYVVETRFVGEQAVPSATGATVIDTNERIIERAEPGPACPTNAGAVMDNVIGGMTADGMGTGYTTGPTAGGMGTGYTDRRI